MPRKHRTAVRTPKDNSEPARRAQRRQAFLEAADAVFCEKGFAAATLDDVIARSGGSRQTLYALFGGKEGLFRAIVAERSATIYGDIGLKARLDELPEDALVAVGIGYLQLMFSPAAIGHYRMVIAEGLRFPEIARAYWAEGPAHNLEQLSVYLAAQVACGRLLLPDPHAAAHHFWGMLQGRIFVEVALALRSRPSKAEIEAIARGAVTQFLDGCRPPTPRRTAKR